jgi:hypothetical protein
MTALAVWLRENLRLTQQQGSSTMTEYQDNTQVGDPWSNKVSQLANQPSQRPRMITVADVLHFCETADVSTESLAAARAAIDERMGRNYDAIAALCGLPKRRARSSSAPVAPESPVAGDASAAG